MDLYDCGLGFGFWGVGLERFREVSKWAICSGLVCGLGFLGFCGLGTLVIEMAIFEVSRNR